METVSKIVNATSDEMDKFIKIVLEAAKPKRIIIDDPPENWNTGTIDWITLFKERSFDYKDGILKIHAR